MDADDSQLCVWSSKDCKLVPGQHITMTLRTTDAKPIGSPVPTVLKAPPSDIQDGTQPQWHLMALCYNARKMHRLVA